MRRESKVRRVITGERTNNKKRLMDNEEGDNIIFFNPFAMKTRERDG